MLGELILETLRQHEARPAVSDPECAVTYRELAERSSLVADLLCARQSSDKRARVGLIAANSVDYVTCYLGVLFSGGVPFLIDAALGPNELALIATECGLDLLIHDSRPVEAIATGPGEPIPSAGDLAPRLTLSALPCPANRPELLEDTEVCRFTSGSTGKPNCIEFSGHAVSAAARNWVTGTELSARDRIACFAALSNGLAFNTSLLSAFVAGASLHLSRGLPTAGHVVRLLERVEANRLIAFPALYESLLRRGVDEGAIGRITIAISSGAPLRDETRRSFVDQLGLSIRNYYGIAETGPLSFARGGAINDGLGELLPGVRLTGGAPGQPAEIRVRSESMGSRYLNAPGVFEARLDDEGFYRTGDEGYLRDGVLFLTGRSKRMINFGGRKIDPIEVAEALRSAPGVHNAVVFEGADSHGDAVVCAVVAGEDALDPATLRAHCASRMAAYKVPSRIHVVAEIPVNSIGKPRINELRELTAVHPATSG